MTAKDFIPIGLLLAILFILIKVLQITKSLQAPVITEDYSPTVISNSSNEEKVTKGKKTRLKQRPSRILKILKSDGKPRTSEEILEVYNAKYKEVTLGNLNSFIRWLLKANLLNKEDVENKGQVFGLAEWFNEEGELEEIYFNKL